LFQSAKHGADGNGDGDGDGSVEIFPECLGCSERDGAVRAVCCAGWLMGANIFFHLLWAYIHW